MQITALKTPLVKENDNLNPIIKNALDDFIKKNQQNKQHQIQPANPNQSKKHFLENTVLAVTSKIVSYAQGRLVDKSLQAQQDPIANKKEKHQLVMQEADFYLPASYSKYNMMMAIKEHTLTINAGVDESNSSGKFVLWPKNLQQSINNIWQFVRTSYNLRNFGVIMTDSRTWPLRWGVVGTCIAHCGFLQLKDYRGTIDLHGREIHMVQVNVAEALAVAATLEMGEVAEQTPLAIAQNIPHIQFQNRPPTKQELNDLHILRKDDAYGPFLNSMKWVEKS